jgi:hypothetical protein
LGATRQADCDQVVGPSGAGVVVDELNDTFSRCASVLSRLRFCRAHFFRLFFRGLLLLLLDICHLPTASDFSG